MTQEEKQLLLKDLCGRLPYGVKINHIIYNWEGTCINFNGKLESFAMEKDNRLCYDVPIEEVRPYLRPMSSMTEEDEEFIYNGHIEFWIREDYCNAHYFDYRGLIDKGLALEAPEDMYKQ